MIIPRTVKIGAHEIDIVWKDKLTHSDGENESLGKAYSYLNRIEMVLSTDEQELPESGIADTFLHEMLHICSITYGLELTESQVAGVAGSVLEVIRRNNLDFRRPGMACKGKGKKKGKGK